MVQSTPVSISTPAPPCSRYVVRDPQILEGEPIVAGTEVAVRDIVLLWREGVKPEEIPEKLFGLVTAAQVFDAISVYLDDPQEVDDRIAWYAVRPILNVPATLRLNPLWDEVVEEIAAYRQAVDREAGLVK